MQVVGDSSGRGDGTAAELTGSGSFSDGKGLTERSPGWFPETYTAGMSLQLFPSTSS